jgi:hypothetical protein
MLSAPLAADASATQIAASMPLARSSLFHSATLERFSADIDIFAIFAFHDDDFRQFRWLTPLFIDAIDTPFRLFIFAAG